MANKEYIEREELLRLISNHPSSPTTEREDRLINAFISVVKTFPAADVRPVVTCGECKHWFGNGTDYCSCDRDALLRERDFFCAAGEKREES